MLCFHQTSDAPSLLESLTGIKISICLQGGRLGTCGPHAEWVLAPGFWGRRRLQPQTSHQASPYEARVTSPQLWGPSKTPSSFHLGQSLLGPMMEWG